MAGSDKRKQSLYFPDEMLKEIQAEAVRQDRSLSWVVQKAWRAARKDIMKLPSLREFFEGRQEATAARVPTVPTERTTLTKKEGANR